MYEGVDIELPKVQIPKEEQDPHSKRLLKVCDLWDKDFSEEQIKRARRAYNDAINYVDDCVGQLLDVLKECELDENTIVIFSGDHGDMLGERGLWYANHQSPNNSSKHEGGKDRPAVHSETFVFPLGTRCRITSHPSGCLSSSTTPRTSLRIGWPRPCRRSTSYRPCAISSAPSPIPGSRWTAPHSCRTSAAGRATTRSSPSTQARAPSASFCCSGAGRGCFSLVLWSVSCCF